jgi:hypothetical protein
MAEEKPPKGTIMIPAPDIHYYILNIVGLTPLLTNKIPRRVFDWIGAKDEGLVAQPKEFVDPEKVFHECIHEMPDGSPGFPGGAWKKSCIIACTSLDRSILTKIAAKQIFHVMAELVKLESDKPFLAEHMGRNKQGGLVLLRRAQFNNWSANLPVRFNARKISIAQLLNLFNTAGLGVGVGCWRTFCDGTFGQYEVKEANRIKRPEIAH